MDLKSIHYRSGFRAPLLIWLALLCISIGATVTVGGATRLTNSGLSITDWKPILGAIPPLSQEDWDEAFEKYKRIPEYQLEHSHLDLQGFKRIYYWEYGHRNLGRWIGIIFLIPFFLFLWRANLSRGLQVRLWGGFFLGGLQGALGWYMVSSGLVDRVDVSHFRLAAHLMLAFVIFIFFFHLFLKILFNSSMRRPAPLFRPWVLGIWALVATQIVFGAFVAGLRAGYAYNTFPQMNGTWLPAAAWTWNPLWLNFLENPTMIQFIHRWLGIGVLILSVIFLVLKLRALRRHHVMTAYTFYLAILGVQILLGIWTLLSGMNFYLALSHQFVGLGLVASLYYFHFLASHKAKVVQVGRI